MRLARIAVKGLTVYDEPQALDLDLLPDGVVAIVGKNGSGKTTLLECVPAAIWGKLPSRRKKGSVYDYATARDAYIELDFEDAGREIRIRLAIDAQARKSERFLWIDGVAVEPKELSGKIEELFGSPELFLASVFASQKKRGTFAELPRVKRKALFVELLGAERFQVLAEAAGKRGDGTAKALELTERELAGHREALAILGDPEAQEAKTRQLIRHETEALETLERDLEKAKTRRTESIARRDALEASTAPGEKIEAALALWGQAQELAASARQRDQERRADSGDRLEKARALMAREPEIKAAKAELQAIEEAETADREIGARIEEARKAQYEAESEAMSAANALEVAETALQVLTDQAGGISEAPCSTDEAWLALADLDHDERLGPFTLGAVDLRGTCPLLSGAREAEGKIEAQAAHVEELKTAATAAEKAAREKIRARQDLEKARVALDPQRDRKRSIASQVAGQAVHLDAAKREIEGVEAEKKAADEVLAREIKEAGRVAPDEPRAKLEAALEALRADAQTEALEVAAIDFAELLDVQSRLDTDVRTVKAQLEKLQRQLGRDQADGSEARKKTARISALEIAAGIDRAQLDDWRLLQDALGRNGVQALLIDAAGPEVSELSNRILEACYSTRFQIEIRTLRPNQKGGGYQEDFSIVAFDEGDERELEDLCGGEGAVVSEALGMALGVYNARRSGVAWETLFRDESAAALDGDNRPKYTSMLRRARELGGFRQVPFVAHSSDLWESTDAQVWITAGTITVGPPS